MGTYSGPIPASRAPVEIPRMNGRKKLLYRVADDDFIITGPLILWNINLETVPFGMRIINGTSYPPAGVAIWDSGSVDISWTTVDFGGIYLETGIFIDAYAVGTYYSVVVSGGQADTGSEVL